LPSIVGGFLAGVAVNAAAYEHPAKGKLEFVARALFIPIFFIVTGCLIAPVAVVQTIFDNFWLVVGIVASLVSGKGIAPAIAGRAFGYARQARLTVRALTLPQVAATLAATLVGYNTFNAAGVRLLDEKKFNAVLVLLVVTPILGPALTQLLTPEMVEQEARTKRLPGEPFRPVRTCTRANLGNARSSSASADRKVMAFTPPTSCERLRCGTHARHPKPADRATNDERQRNASDFGHRRAHHRARQGGGTQGGLVGWTDSVGLPDRPSTLGCGRSRRNILTTAASTLVSIR
jgi:hypothetical protein